MTYWQMSLAGAFLLTVGSIGTARGDTVTFAGSSGHRSAAVTFTHTGTQLTISLQNTSNADALAPDDVLAGIFFGMADGSTNALSKSGGTARVGGGSSVYQLGDGPGYPAGFLQRPDIVDIGGEWAFKAFSRVDYEYGLGSSGFNSPFEFGVGDLFGGTNYSGPKSPNGMQFGLLSAGDDLSTRNGGMIESAGEYFIKDSALFTLVVPETFVLSDIDAVRFQYGTSLGQPSHPGVIIPLPAAAWAGLALFGVLGAGKVRCRLRGK